MENSVRNNVIGRTRTTRNSTRAGFAAFPRACVQSLIWRGRKERVRWWAQVWKVEHDAGWSGKFYLERRKQSCKVWYATRLTRHMNSLRYTKNLQERVPNLNMLSLHDKHIWIDPLYAGTVYSYIQNSQKHSHFPGSNNTDGQNWHFLVLVTCLNHD